MAVRAAERELRSRGWVAFRWWWVEERLSCDGGVAVAPGRAVRAVPCRGRGAPSMEVEAERSASNYGK